MNERRWRVWSKRKSTGYISSGPVITLVQAEAAIEGMKRQFRGRGEDFIYWIEAVEEKETEDVRPWEEAR